MHIQYSLYKINSNIRLLTHSIFFTLTGDFSNAVVDLTGNYLPRFDESVFRPMLEQMVTGSGEIEFDRGSIALLNILCGSNQL